MKTSRKPIYPILPSTYTASGEVKAFLQKGHVNFPDEVLFAHALGLAHFTPKPAIIEEDSTFSISDEFKNKLKHHGSGYLSPELVAEVLDAAYLPRVREIVITKKEELEQATGALGFPLVMKVVGPLHKSDMGGVILNIKNPASASETYDSLMRINGANGVLLQPMVKGLELFAGVKYEKKFGHFILCGMGGIFIEVLKDFSVGLSPISMQESMDMIKRLNIYPVLKGIRGQHGIDLQRFAEILVRLSNLVREIPQIMEMDLNPLLALEDQIFAVDARILVEFE